MTGSKTAKRFREFRQLNQGEIAAEILAFWEREDIFNKSITTREGKAAYVFYEGPPSANGMPGIHHVLARTIKDMFCRFKTLQGYQVHRKGGWDTHGLPVELGVEKMLGITKKDIGDKISVAEYNARCREEVMRYKDAWDDITRQMGYWVDLENPYITFKNDYIESIWWLLRQFYDKRLLYKGLKIQPYSPAAGTGLSSHELNLPGCYREVKDTSCVAQFTLKKESVTSQDILNEAAGAVYFLAWTTTPWTLPSNTALAVGGNITYVLVQTFNPYTFLPVNVILAEDLLTKYFKQEQAELNFSEYQPGDKQIPYKILGSLKGKDLDGLRYEQLLPYAQPEEGDAFRVLIGDFVSTEDGTGIVHIAPSFGADDMRVAQQFGIGNLTLVDKQGRFVDEVTDFAGEQVKEAYLTDEEKEAARIQQGRDKYLSVDDRIVIKLKQENKCFKSERYEHNYPHCWRTDKPIIYYPLDSWFIRVTALKDRMVALNKTINWKPASTGEGRFGQWLENLVDWNLSRSRYWGTPLPIWRTAEGTEEKCIGSIAELRAEVDKAVGAGLMTASLADDFDLHKPYVDDIVLLSDAGQPMTREPELIDVWFDSGAVPYAQWHYPFENKDIFARSFPADFIAEGVDQTRGWFYTLHAIAVMLFDSVAFKNVVSNGLVLDKNGNKMSKRLGNAVDPFETIKKYGADATRWYMISNSQPWDNLKFDIAGVEEVNRKFFGTLFNTYGFFALYANIDQYVPGAQPAILLQERAELDRWIISRLHSLKKEVTDHFGDYEPTRAARAMEDFVDRDLSNWYVRLSRRRFWKTEDSADKRAAYDTLYECLLALSQMMSPLAPFFSDWLYRNLSSGKAESSVHLNNWAYPEPACIDVSLEERMEMAQEIASLVLSLRKKEKIKVRQPLSRILVPVLDAKVKKQLERVKDVILAEVNVKALEFVEDTAGVVKKKVKPNFQLLGKKLGAKMKLAAAAITALTQDNMTTLERNGYFDINLEGEPYRLLAEEVEIMSEDIPGWLVAGSGTLTVALDISISDELQQEGDAREFVNKIQNLRKELDFNVTDKINIQVARHPRTDAAITAHKSYICAETQAVEIDTVEGLVSETIVDINGEQVALIIEQNN
jgi:isoleucyl-tRNA synthetase